MWDKEKYNESLFTSYMKYGTSQMQNMGIDAEAELLRILGKELWNCQDDMCEIKEDRRKYLLIRR